MRPICVLQNAFYGTLADLCWAKSGDQIYAISTDGTVMSIHLPISEITKIIKYLAKNISLKPLGTPHVDKIEKNIELHQSKKRNTGEKNNVENMKKTSKIIESDCPSEINLRKINEIQIPFVETPATIKVIFLI